MVCSSFKFDIWPIYVQGINGSWHIINNNVVSNRDYCQTILGDPVTTIFDINLIGTTSQLILKNIAIIGQNRNHNVFNIRSDPSK